MITNPDGTFNCTSCGFNVGNGGVSTAVVVSDLDPDQPGMVRNLRFCRDRTEDDGTVVKGCGTKLLRPSLLRHYTETKESSNG